MSNVGRDSDRKDDFDNHKIRKLSPSDLVSDTGSVKDLKSEGFFLTLALIFNDLKGVGVFWDWLGEYRVPSAEETSIHSGEFSGLRIQLSKILIGNLHEILLFIRASKEIIQSPSFKKIESQLSDADREIWCVIVEISTEDNSYKVDPGLKLLREQLLKIRNNAAFHYQDAAKVLISGFRKFFFDMNLPSDSQNQWAYYSSLQSQWKKTRYYYADAALNGYLYDRISDSGVRNEIVFWNDVFNLASQIARVINSVLTKYHESKLNI